MYVKDGRPLCTAGGRIILDTNMWNDFDFSMHAGAATVDGLANGPSPVLARIELNLRDSTVNPSLQTIDGTERMR